jgi:hypothetical protein
MQCLTNEMYNQFFSIRVLAELLVEVQIGQVQILNAEGFHLGSLFLA